MNYIPEIAKMLGVEIGEEFNLTIGGVTDVSCKFILTENGLACRCNGKQWYSNYLNQILYGSCKIVKIPKPILDDVEKKYLSRIIRPWRDKVEYIRKINFDDEDEFIVIIYRERESKAMPLPCFKKGTMYKGMEVGKEYSLEELNI